MARQEYLLLVHLPLLACESSASALNQVCMCKSLTNLGLPSGHDPKVWFNQIFSLPNCDEIGKTARSITYFEPKSKKQNTALLLPRLSLSLSHKAMWSISCRPTSYMNIIYFSTVAANTTHGPASNCAIFRVLARYLGLTDWNANREKYGLWSESLM